MSGAPDHASRDHASRDHALLSASSSARWLECPPSARIAERHPRQDTEFTREGTVAHEVAEVIARVGRAQNLKPGDLPEGATEEMVTCAQAYADYIHEQTDVPGCSILLEQRISYAAWAPEGFGTADCLIFHPNGLLDVVDYKYGKGVKVEAARNPQMMLYALGAVNEFGFVYTIDRVRVHIFQPRLSHASTYELPVSALVEWGEKIHPTAKKAFAGKGKQKAGQHCKFCPHAALCPELAAFSILAASDGATLNPSPDTLTPEGLAKALALSSIVETWIKRVGERALADLAAGKQVPGYKLVEGKLGNRKWADELKVAEALKQAGIPSEDYLVTTLASPAVLDKTLGKKKAAELVGGMITRAPGKPTVVPDTDGRPAYDRRAEAFNDFN